MEQSQYTNIVQPQPYEQDQQETKSKAPIFVKIIGGLVLIQGICVILIAILMIFVSLFALVVGGPEGLFLWVILVLIKGAGLVVVSSGIRDMRLWSLYSFTLLLILTTGFSLFSLLIMELKDPTSFANIGLGINVLELVYLWSIFKKFK